METLKTQNTHTIELKQQHQTITKVETKNKRSQVHNAALTFKIISFVTRALWLWHEKVKTTLEATELVWFHTSGDEYILESKKKAFFLLQY